MNKICIVTTSPLSIKHFLNYHIRNLAINNKVYVVTSSDLSKEFKNKNVICLMLPFARRPKIWQDLICLFRFLIIVYLYKFNLILSVSPKAGFIAMLASRILFVEYRIHWFTGQIWANFRGFKFHFYKFIDQLIAKCCTSILVDSYSQNSFLLINNVFPKWKSHVLGSGSICGVDIARFSPNESDRLNNRNALNVKSDECLFLYIGRLCTDKGLLDLAEAFKLCHCIKSKLLIIGPDEELIWDRILNIVGEKRVNIIRIDYIDNPEHYMLASDVLIMPSHREGFGLVVLEAAACGIPCIGTDIYGLTDAVENGKTGVLYEKGDIKSLSCLMQKFSSDKIYRKKMGEAARKRAITKFNNTILEDLFLKHLKTLGFMK
jgi:glycosyltransferase involved in cell wall biosynthesis